MRNNISSVRTKNMMAATLISLMKTKNIDKITVRDITEKCGVNRQTFYYHFHDIYQLAEWSFKEKASELLGDKVLLSNWDEALLKVAVFVRENKDVLTGVVTAVGNHYVTNFIYDYIRPYIKNIITILSEGKNIDNYYNNFLSNYYTVTFSTILLEWILTGEDENMSPNELVRLIKITTEGNIESAINRYASLQ